jgi:CRISPR-associated protein Cas2
MARRRYLVAYDIRDDRRLRSIAVCMEGYGERIQYSVFVADLSDREKYLMRSDIESRMKNTEDSVMIIDWARSATPPGSSSWGTTKSCLPWARLSSDRERASPGVNLKQSSESSSREM